MRPDLQREGAQLERLSVGQLHAQYATLFGEATRSRHRRWLIRRILWRMQVLAEGDLTERALRRAAELANDADLRLTPPQGTSPEKRPIRDLNALDPRLPPVGTVLARRYKGQSIEVQVLPSGFAYGGCVFPSLSAVAKSITGSHCNGYLFFKLSKSGGNRAQE